MVQSCIFCCSKSPTCLYHVTEYCIGTLQLHQNKYVQQYEYKKHSVHQTSGLSSSLFCLLLGKVIQEGCMVLAISLGCLQGASALESVYGFLTTNLLNTFIKLTMIYASTDFLLLSAFIEYHLVLKRQDLLKYSLCSTQQHTHVFIITTSGFFSLCRHLLYLFNNFNCPSPDLLQLLTSSINMHFQAKLITSACAGLGIPVLFFCVVQSCHRSVILCPLTATVRLSCIPLYCSQNRYGSYCMQKRFLLLIKRIGIEQEAISLCF